MGEESKQSTSSTKELGDRIAALEVELAEARKEAAETRSAACTADNRVISLAKKLKEAADVLHARASTAVGRDAS